MLIAPAGLGEEANAAFIEGFLQADDEAALTPWLRLLVADPAALGSSIARTTLRLRAAFPLLAAQKRLAEALFAGRRQAFGVRRLLAAPDMPVKVVIGLQDTSRPPITPKTSVVLSPCIGFPASATCLIFKARREVVRLIDELARAGRPE